MDNFNFIQIFNLIETLADIPGEVLKIDFDRRIPRSGLKIPNDQEIPIGS